MQIEDCLTNVTTIKSDEMVTKDMLPDGEEVSA